MCGASYERCKLMIRSGPAVVLQKSIECVRGQEIQ
jgi:hypothetical protein